MVRANLCGVAVGWCLARSLVSKVVGKFDCWPFTWLQVAFPILRPGVSASDYHSVRLGSYDASIESSHQIGLSDRIGLQIVEEQPFRVCVGVWGGISA
ncbi:hypothetical protein Q8A67_010234 [Cirrhinus molitorella]|uniref:Uncharacterized protein n=1 Tax=Cirrhinus molitorella TaxID=172907 RepID=A0AA88TQ95_9TELE|nr:hypothetical protein Q8A67_010234 [Cirrhinus molitorella]